MHSGCADPCDFPKCGKLDCIICGSGGLRSRFPLACVCGKTEGGVYGVAAGVLAVRGHPADFLGNQQPNKPRRVEKRLENDVTDFSSACLVRGCH